MSIGLPILLAAATLSGSGSLPPSSRPAELTTITASPPRLTLIAAASAAARRESLALDRKALPVALAAGPVSGRRPNRHSVPTRATAIFAGAFLGSLAGMVGGGAIDAATSNGECLTFMKYGMPIGAAVGAVLTARWVR
jgi:hypothetical protein